MIKSIDIKNNPDAEQDGKRAIAIFQMDDGKTRTTRFGSYQPNTKTPTTFYDGASVAKRQAYLARHKTNEDWSKSGIMTAGYLSRWVLWEKPMKNKRDIKIKIAKDLNIPSRRITITISKQS